MNKVPRWYVVAPSWEIGFYGRIDEELVPEQRRAPKAETRGWHGWRMAVIRGREAGSGGA